MCVGRAINDRLYLRVQEKNTVFRHATRTKSLAFSLFFLYHGKKNSWHIKRCLQRRVHDSLSSFKFSPTSLLFFSLPFVLYNTNNYMSNWKVFKGHSTPGGNWTCNRSTVPYSSLVLDTLFNVVLLDTANVMRESLNHKSEACATQFAKKKKKKRRIIQ